MGWDPFTDIDKTPLSPAPTETAHFLPFHLPTLTTCPRSWSVYLPDITSADPASTKPSKPPLSPISNTVSTPMLTQSTPKMPVSHVTPMGDM